MIARSLLLSVIVLGSTLACTTSAKAGSVDVLFNGVVQQACTFSNKVDGQLALDATGTTLSSLAAGGTAGTVTVTCNAPATLLTINAPVSRTAPAGYTDASATKTVLVTGGVGLNVTLPGGVGVGTGLLLLGINNLSVNMTAGLTTPLPAGDYQYAVTLTTVGP